LPAAVAALVLLGIPNAAAAQPAPPDIPFADLVDTSVKDPDNPAKTFRVDFARLERETPLSRADRIKITPENLAVLPQEYVDQVYGRLTAGSVPDGVYVGNLFLPRDDAGTLATLKARVEEIVGDLGGALAGASVEQVERVARALWKGQAFDREQRLARNMIEDLPLLRPLLGDGATIPTATIPRGGPLGRLLPSDRVWLLFPAKVYCGQSLLEGRRESVVTDHMYSDEIAGYRVRPDELAGRRGLKVRAEIRMVRPGFYLGRVYANRVFLMNFTLFSPDIAENETAGFAAGNPSPEECWPGEQARTTAR
jgi:hypothetical protein